MIPIEDNISPVYTENDSENDLQFIPPLLEESPECIKVLFIIIPIQRVFS